MYSGYLETYENPSQPNCGLCGGPPSLYPTFSAVHPSYGHVGVCVYCWLDARSQIGAKDFDTHTENCEKCDSSSDVANILRREGII